MSTTMESACFPKHPCDGVCEPLGCRATQVDEASSHASDAALRFMSAILAHRLHDCTS